MKKKRSPRAIKKEKVFKFWLGSGKAHLDDMIHFIKMKYPNELYDFCYSILESDYDNYETQ